MASLAGLFAFRPCWAQHGRVVVFRRDVIRSEWFLWVRVDRVLSDESSNSVQGGEPNFQSLSDAAREPVQYFAIFVHRKLLLAVKSRACRFAPDRVPVLLKDGAPCISACGRRSPGDRGGWECPHRSRCFAHLTRGCILPAKCSWTYPSHTALQIACRQPESHRCSRPV
jgi:hypothetical protein